MAVVSDEALLLARASVRIALAMQLARDIQPDDTEIASIAAEIAREICEELCAKSDGAPIELGEWRDEMIEWERRGGFSIGPPPVPHCDGEPPVGSNWVG